MTLTALLALFALLAISCGTYYVSERIKVPYTVLLVAVGLLLVPITKIPAFEFLKDFTLTPELLFYLFLPILIFEAGYNIKLRQLQENIYSISGMAVISLILSVLVVAGGLYGAFSLINLAIPFIVLLIFGALISATDPVAVLALFKEYGAPRRLSLMFEGESLFNDGTAVALFLVLLEVALKGYNGVSTIAEGLFLFVSMVVGGVIFGLVMGILFAKLIELTRSNENVSILLMLVLAHLSFILAEVVSHHLVIAGMEIKISAIIATTIASIVLGNYGRYKAAPQAEEFIHKFWGQFAFMVNSLVFILMGLLFAALPFSMLELLLPIAIAVVVVAVARAFSVYPVVWALNALRLEENIPPTWQHLLAWGSLRGALAITMVLLIPADWAPQNWAYDFTPRDFIMALTIGCIYATLFIKALTIGPMIRRMGLDSLSEVEKIEYRDASAYIHRHVLNRLATLKDKGYVDTLSHDKVQQRMEAIHQRAQSRFKAPEKSALMHAAVNMHALGIERYYLHDLLRHGEINDRIMRRVEAMISNQLDRLERGEILGDHPGSVPGDWLDILITKISSMIGYRKNQAFEDAFLYYRAKAIISRKVVKEMSQYCDEKIQLFSQDDVQPVIGRYRNYQKNAEAHMAKLVTDHGKSLEKINASLASLAADKHQHELLDELLHRELVSPKVHISLQSKLEIQKN